MNKDAMVEALGDTELLLPERLNRGLAAHDRVTYYLALLQAARRRAAQPDQPVLTTLREEREASGVDDDWLDGVVEQSRPAAGGDIYVPASQQIVQQLFAEIELMLQPLRSAGAVAPDLGAAAAIYARRLSLLHAEAPSAAADRMSPAAIEVLTRRGDADGDSLHRLKTDLFKELSRVQALIADDVIEGAHTYGLGPNDAELVTAFMKGVAETAPLKLDRPGLATTATRVGARLSIQNEIDTTDAHVAIVHIEGMTATVIYSDAYRSRVAFLRELLGSFDVRWHDGEAPAGDTRPTAVGSFTAHDTAELARFLTFVGSRLVFLIDWKRARRNLAQLVKKSDAVAVLRWAAEHGVGHGAFLQVDGSRLVARAFEAAVAQQPANSLSAALGREEARTFLSEVMRITWNGLRAGHSTALIQDEVEVELLRHIQPDGHGLMCAAAEHAVYIFALAERLRHVFVRVVGSLNGDVARTAELAKMWETRADEIVGRWSRIMGRSGDGRGLSHLLSRADKAADALEYASYLITLLPPDHVREGLGALGSLPELVSRSAKEYVRCLDYAKEQGRVRTPADVAGMLLAADRIATLEHESDVAQRDAEARLVQSAASFRELHVLTRIVSSFEQASNALASCAVLVKDQMLTADADAGGRA